MISPVAYDTQEYELFKDEDYSTVQSRKTIDNYPPNEYFPTNLTPGKSPTELDIQANAYAVMDRQTGELLLGKNIAQEKQIASLTKVMTAIVALDKERLDREIVVSKTASEVGEATMGLTYGERYTLEELLYGLLMISGNDAAEAVATSLGRGRNWFINEMNKKALQLGLFDTYFVNPTGLDGDSSKTSTFSTALDLLALSNYALQNDTFSEIVATKYHTIDYSENYHKAVFLENLINFNLTYPGIKGVKTGNTEFAGQTLISYAENNGRQILVVLLDSSATRDDAIRIYQYIFEGNMQ